MSRAFDELSDLGLLALQVFQQLRHFLADGPERLMHMVGRAGEFGPLQSERIEQAPDARLVGGEGLLQRSDLVVHECFEFARAANGL